MIEGKQRKPYWRETKMLVVGTLILPGIVMLILPFWSDELAGPTVIGFPVGYLLASHVAVLVAVAAAARFILRQDEIDRWHGAHEDF
jgi:putative solute:sodium symporter small subunit